MSQVLDTILDTCDEHLEEKPNTPPEPSAKRLKATQVVQVEGSPTDKIKWVQDPADGGLVPFVMSGTTNVVHCGKAEMKIIRMQFANGPSAVVECIKGCEEGCGKTTCSCTCLCHLLKAHYISRDPTVTVQE